MAAAAMWTIWIVAYVTGMSSLALMPRVPRRRRWSAQPWTGR
jgi:hypothetical protein